MYRVMIEGHIYSDEYEDIDEAIEYACYLVDSSYIGIEEWCMNSIADEYDGEIYDYKEPIFVIIEVED